MKKVTVSLLLIAVLFGVFVSAASALDTTNIYLNGSHLALPAGTKSINGTLFVPLKDIASTLGATVNWDAASRTATVRFADKEAKVVSGQAAIAVDGAVHPISVPPYTVRGRLMVPLQLLSLVFPVETNWDQKSGRADIYGPLLPTVGSRENLLKLLDSAVDESSKQYGRLRNGLAMDMADGLSSQAKTAAPEAANQAADYSGTNVQVAGVDEADIVKTDGQYIYQVNRNRVIVIKAYPAASMEIAGSVQFSDPGFAPQELYLDGNRLIVIGTAYNPVVIAKNGAGTMVAPDIYPPYRQYSTVKAVIYDRTDKADLKLLREVEIEGNYLDSRLVGSSLYLAANRYLNYYYRQQEGEEPVPAYRDSAGADTFAPVPYSSIRYFPGAVEPNYLVLAGINLADPEAEADVSAYLGSGQNIYASTDNLYIAVPHYGPVTAAPATESKRIAPPWRSEAKTVIYKFALEAGKIRQRGQGEVPGTILNQFSMDEYDGSFRIATTGQKMQNDGSFISANNLYVLDSQLNISGSIEDIAPGESIYSVRFMGERGYMVTFQKVDPLFVLDLKDPKAPRILGALKIPGYSDYLHPYDATHLIGFGKDTIEVPLKDGSGQETDTMAFYQGMKIAIFDVSDVAHPKEIAKEIIGDRGTDSPLLHDHKALLFSREKKLLAFPVTLNLIQDREKMQNGFPAYGEFAYQGAYIYQVDLEEGFRLRGRITHLQAEDYQKSGYNWYDSNLNVERIIYIGDTLYTISQGKIKANAIADLKEIGTLAIPQ